MCLILVSCTNNQSTDSNLEKIGSKTDSIKPKEIKRWASIIDKENLIVEGNSNVDESMIQSVKVKFEPYVWFEDFPAKIKDTITKAPLDFSTNHDAKYYITAIKTGYKEANSTFGGHYELIMWGCGFPCAHGVIVDRKTGRMVHLPQSSTGYEFRSNSLMLIVNPTDEDNFYNLNDEYLMPPAIYLFDENKKEFKLLEPKGH
jgi:hypothetical protein